MGGPGSGGSRTWNPRARVEEHLSLHVGTLGRDLADVGSWRWVAWSGRQGESDRISLLVLDDGVRLSYTVTPCGGSARDVDEFVAVEWTPCPYGGRRPWWLCPGCGRRCGVLHGVGDRFRCRPCHGLAYRSQVEKPMDRAFRAGWKLRDRLGARSRHDLGRPRGMHLSTYGRLLERIEAADQAAWGGIESLLAAWNERRDRLYRRLGVDPDTAGIRRPQLDGLVHGGHPRSRLEPGPPSAGSRSEYKERTNLGEAGPRRRYLQL
jgi:hypothetical protein